MKTAKRVLSVLIVLFLALKFSPYGYLIKGVKGAYFDGHTSAHIYDRKHFDQREMPVLNSVPLVSSAALLSPSSSHAVPTHPLDPPRLPPTYSHHNKYRYTPNPLPHLSMHP